MMIFGTLRRKTSMIGRTPLKVLITIDTEVWPRRQAWLEERLEGDLQRDMYGVTGDGEFGIAFQSQMFRDHGLQGIFFVEPLFAYVVGIAPLVQIVNTIRKHDGGGIELHAHPEWLRHFSPPGLPEGMLVQHFHELTAEQQASVLELARKNLQSAGVARTRAFRAGNFGADLDTCRALKGLGVLFDFSYNASFTRTWCKIQSPRPLFKPSALGGVIEFPMTCFRDWPGHIRHAQLCACSFSEMRNALNQAWRLGWRYFVILSHSAELLKRTARPQEAILNRVALHRLEHLCRFLRDNNDRFTTITCETLDPADAAEPEPGYPLPGWYWNTVVRYVQQGWARL